MVNHPKGTAVADRKGFSMIELLVAMTILAIVIVGVGMLFAASMRSTTQIRLNNRAISLAESKVEELERLPVGSSQLTAGSHGPEVLENIFSRTWQVTTNSPSRYLSTVTITVAWRAVASTDTTRVILQTYIKAL